MKSDNSCVSRWRKKISRQFWRNGSTFDLEKYVWSDFCRIDLCLTYQVSKSKYSDEERPSVGGNYLVLVLTTEVEFVILQEVDFDCREYQLPPVFEAWSDCKD